MADDPNLETAKAAYEAFSSGDAAGAMEGMADDVEWIVPGDSAISGTYRGKEEVGGLWAKLAEKNFKTAPEYWFSDGERVVVLTHITLDGGEADQVDVFTYRDGKAVKYQGAGDTAMQARIFGS